MAHKIIIGAGLYGLYSALYCVKQGDSVSVLEYDSACFSRATYINQARVHMGYHYPRSISTALKSKAYFDKFNEDYEFCINKNFEKVYATSANFSWTDKSQFIKFCKDANIKCEEISQDKYFKNGMCDGTFLTTEYTYDANLLKNYFLKELNGYENCKIIYNAQINTIEKKENNFEITLSNGQTLKSGFILNATYANVNRIHNFLNYEPFKIKYELCEIILCKISSELQNVGITVMDGPFFSIMPFGKTGLHSLTSVTFTPHTTSYDVLPTFKCQEKSGGYCSPLKLGNCNNCKAKPQSAWPYMANLARKYLKDDYAFEYETSLFSVKPILMASEIDDSRPTVIRKFSDNPTFISVLSGKINTVYDLNEVLKNEH